MSKIEEQVIEKMLNRAEVGLNKYGVTMERDDLSLLEWVVHWQEETMDASIYAQRIINEIEAILKRNEWLEEVVALLQEEGVDLSTEGFPIWNEDGTITRE